MRSKRIFIFLLFLFFYYLILIFKSSFVINNVRHFCLFDDMMISMRYANNFSHGYGLVWNTQAEKVEGYSNFLWTVYMAFFHKLSIPNNLTSFFIQLTGAVFILGTLYFVFKIASLIAKNSGFLIWSSIVFTGLYFPLINWSVILGTEVSILTFLSVASCFLVLKSGKNPPFVLYLLLFCGILVRLDFAVFVIAVFAFMLFSDKKNLKNVIQGMIFVISGIVLFTLFRYFYYHELFPNTYFLKATGYPLLLRIARGIYVSLNIVNPLILFAAAIGVILIRNRFAVLFGLIFTAQVFYSIFVGGDAWEFLGGANRYVVIAMPEFFLLFFYVLYNFRKLLDFRRTGNNKYKIIFSVFLVVAFLTFNSGSDNTLLQLFLFKDPLIKQDNIINVKTAYAINEATATNVTIAVTWAGIVPYFSNRYFIDLLGKNDSFIAHEKAHLSNANGPLRKIVGFWPGHMKWDYDYSLGKRKPDAVITVYPLEDAIYYLNKDYVQVSYKGTFFYARKGSKQIKWEKVKKQ